MIAGSNQCNHTDFALTAPRCPAQPTDIHPMFHTQLLHLILLPKSCSELAVVHYLVLQYFSQSFFQVDLTPDTHRAVHPNLFLLSVFSRTAVSDGAGGGSEGGCHGNPLFPFC